MEKGCRGRRAAGGGLAGHDRRGWPVRGSAARNPPPAARLFPPPRRKPASVSFAPMLRLALLLALPAWSAAALAIARHGGRRAAWATMLLLALVLAAWA